MNMTEALEWAADYAERNKIFQMPTKSNGYLQDGAKPPTPAEKAQIITDLAYVAVRGDNEKFLRNVFHNLGEARVEGAADPTAYKGHIETIYRNIRTHLEGKD